MEKLALVLFYFCISSILADMYPGFAELQDVSTSSTTFSATTSECEGWSNSICGVERKGNEGDHLNIKKILEERNDSTGWPIPGGSLPPRKGVEDAVRGEQGRDDSEWTPRIISRGFISWSSGSRSGSGSNGLGSHPDVWDRSPVVDEELNRYRITSPKSGSMGDRTSLLKTSFKMNRSPIMEKNLTRPRVTSFEEEWKTDPTSDSKGYLIFEEDLVKNRTPNLNEALRMDRTEGLEENTRKNPSPSVKGNSERDRTNKMDSFLDEGRTPGLFLETSFEGTATPLSSKETRIGRIRRRVADSPLDKRALPPLSESHNFVRGRKHPGGHNVDSIIQGIMKLLGGNVKLTASESKNDKPVTFGTSATRHPTTSRINNRGPPRLPPFPFLPPGPPIRPPVTPPSERDEINPDRPQFVANTRPPFLLPLPPALSAKPPLGRPALTGIPIPEDVLLNLQGGIRDEVEPVTQRDVSTSELTERTVPEADRGNTEVSDPVYETTQSLEETPTDPPPTPPPLEPSLSSMSSTRVTQTPGVEFPLFSSKISEAMLGTHHPPGTPDPLTTSARESHPNEVLPLATISPPQTSIVSTRTEYSPPLVSTTSSPLSSLSRPSSHSTHVPYIHTLTHNLMQFPTRLPTQILPFPTTGHPGLVLADSLVPSQEYEGQLITAVPTRAFGQNANVFDVTVSALQGYGAPSRPPVGNVAPLITTSRRQGDGSVYIDGRKTFFNLLSPATTQAQQALGVGTVIPEPVKPPPLARPPQKYDLPPSPSHSFPTRRPVKLPTRRPVKLPTLGPPKRIDTCIVGYDTTCKEELGEVCRTEGDVSSCYCRPGMARRRARTKCKKSVLLHLSLKVDRIGERRVLWGENYANPDSQDYQLLAYESQKALDSAFGQSRPMSSLYMESQVKAFYSLGGRIIVNSTIKLLYTPQTASPNIRKSLQRHLIKVIKSNNNYVGDSALAVEGPLNPVPDVSDVNECFDSSLYDCHKEADCTNSFGSYSCVCKKGFTDRYPDDSTKSGRFCDSCSRDFCTKRGECRIENEQNVCICEDSYYGSRCEIEGEVIAVAVGASVAAIVIIILTLVFLCMWSQRWKAQDRKTETLSRLPGGGWFWGGRLRGRSEELGGDSFSVNIHQKGAPPGSYGVTMEDRIRWAQIAETLSRQNVYTPSSASLAAPTPFGDSLARLQMPQDPYGLSGLLSSASERGGVVGDVLRLFRRRGKGSTASQPPQDPLQRLTPQEALTLHKLITLQAQLNVPNPPEHMRSPCIPDQHKILPGPNEQAGMSQVPSFPQHFGMQHLGQPYLSQTYGTRPHSTYGQYAPTSLNSAPSVGGVSRAPTLAARTPLPMRDALGEVSMLGPLGGGLATKGGNSDSVGALLTESSEEDHERPYQLPRPKSRSSVLDNDDFYYDPDDLLTSQSRLPPLPSSPPPPLPFHFDQFFKSNFP